MNTLAYIKLNKPKGEELDHVKRNAKKRLVVCPRGGR